MGRYSGKAVWENATHILIEKTGDNGILFVLILLLIVFIFALVAMLSLIILPIIFILIGIFITRTKRYLFGLFAIISYIYLFIDKLNGWFAYIIIYGNKQYDSWLQFGLFDGKIGTIADYLSFANVIACLLGFLFVIQSIRSNK